MNIPRKSKSVLMVCIDNICRSPIAEAVMHNIIVEAGLESDWRVESAGIEGWHLGEKADPRVLSVLDQHNIKYNSCAQRVVANDFHRYDYIFGMDQSVMASLRQLMPLYANAKLLLLSDFLFGLKPNERIIKDPYYDMGEASFIRIYKQCLKACQTFLNQARSNQIVA